MERAWRKNLNACGRAKIVGHLLRSGFAVLDRSRASLVDITSTIRLLEEAMIKRVQVRDIDLAQGSAIRDVRLCALACKERNYARHDKCNSSCHRMAASRV